MPTQKQHITGITRAQYDMLQGFYAHCYTVYHDYGKAHFGFWAEELDKSEIPWRVQNSVAVIAESKESIALYLSSHLKERGIQIH